MKIKKVTRTGFTTEDGRTYSHPEPLDVVPSVEVFQNIYDYWEKVLTVGMDKNLEDFGAGTPRNHHRSKPATRRKQDLVAAAGTVITHL